jgi:hypothetical protein
MERLMTTSKLQVREMLTRSRKHYLRERLSGLHQGPTKGIPELTRPRNVTIPELHQLNPPDCPTLCLASQNFLLPDSQ